MTNEVTITEHQQAAAPQLSHSEVIEQVALIQKVMQSVMKDGEHYGKIPGTDKASLLKPGAEKLCLTFRLAPRYNITRIDHENGHREYEIIASLWHIPTGKLWGEGVGLCSTMEKKYRYRADYENTGKQVPKAYWDLKRDPAAIGGKGFVARKNEDGVWMIYKTTGQIENPDLAETYNTVLKMAKKRALVDATLNTCAASDIFAQDLEDLVDDIPTPATVKKEAETQEKPIQGKPENLAAQAKWEAENKRMKALPDDIKDFFKWKKMVSREKILAVMDENHDDYDAIRSWMKGQGWQGSAGLSDAATEAMPG